MHRFPQVLTYLYWLSWSVIVGGLVVVSLLAPLAFFTLPPLTTDSVQAVAFSGKLLTLLFGRYLPVCAVAFGIITLLELRYVQYDWHSEKKVRFALQTLIFLMANGVWIYLAFYLVPAMQPYVMSPEYQGGLTGEVKALFQQQHKISTRLTYLGLVFTLCVPYFHLTRFPRKPENPN